MSFDIFLQRFHNGEIATFRRSEFEEIFGPYVCSRESRFMRVEFPDGSGSDIYIDEGDPDGATFNHCGGDAFFAALYELAARTQAGIYWPDDPQRAAATDAATLQHLPPNFVECHAAIQLVHSGSELIACISGA
jgi:hypothetical protein